MKKLSFLLMLVTFLTTASFALDTEGKMPKEKKDNVEKTTCTVTVTYGNVTVTSTVTCPCPQQSSCKMAFTLATAQVIM